MFFQCLIDDHNILTLISPFQAHIAELHARGRGTASQEAGINFNVVGGRDLITNDNVYGLDLLPFCWD
jgi:hypothetical protein